MDKIQQLKIFCSIVNTASFSQTAAHFNLARSRVSYAIQALEKEYEVLLFHRSTRHVSLTQEGQLFYDEAKLLLAKLTELGHFKQNLTGFGRIRIGMPKRVAQQIIIPQLTDFYQHYPNVKLHISSQDDFSNLPQQQLDCVVRFGTVMDEYLHIRPLATIPVGTFAAPCYLQHYGTPQHLHELKSHFAVAYLATKSTAKTIELHFKDHAIKMAYRIAVEDTQAYLQAGRAGLGIIQIPYFDAMPDVTQGRLTPILGQLEHAAMPVNLLLTDKKYRPQYVQDFITWVEQTLIVALGSTKP